MRAFANANRYRSRNPFNQAFREADAIVDCVRLRSRQALEGEINAGAHHAEVVIRAIYHIPAEITDPADMRRHADFDAATELADSLGCRTSLLSSDNVVRLAFLNVST